MGGGASGPLGPAAHRCLGSWPDCRPGPAWGGAAALVLPAVPAVTRSHTRLPQVVQRIKAVEGQTRLLVVDKETDEELRRRQLTCTEEMARRGLPPAHDPWEPKPDWARTGSLSSEAAQEVRRALLTATTLAASTPPSRPPLPSGPLLRPC